MGSYSVERGQNIIKMWLATFFLLICIVSHSHNLFKDFTSDDFFHSIDSVDERFGYGHDEHKGYKSHHKGYKSHGGYGHDDHKGYKSHGGYGHDNHHKGYKSHGGYGHDDHKGYKSHGGHGHSGHKGYKSHGGYGH